MPASPRPETRGGNATSLPERRVHRVVPVGTMGQAISLRVQSLRAEPARSRDRLGRLALLTPSCGGLCADREEKRVTHGSDRAELDHQEQLDRNRPNQRRSSLTATAPIREALSLPTFTSFDQRGYSSTPMSKCSTSSRVPSFS